MTSQGYRPTSAPLTRAQVIGRIIGYAIGISAMTALALGWLSAFTR